MTAPLLHTERLKLRAPEPEDLDVMFLFENDEELWLDGGVTGPYSRYQLKKYIAETKNDIYADGQLRLMMEDTDGQVVGIVDLFNFDVRNHRAEVGIVVRKEFRRQKFATEALRLLERHCFGYLGIHQLYAYIQKRNEASRNLFGRMGYRQTGVLTDWIYLGGTYRDVCVMQKNAISHQV